MMVASFPGRSFPVFNYWRGRKREPGIHCVRMRQLCDAADASTAQCDAADVTNRVGGLHVILMRLIFLKGELRSQFEAVDRSGGPQTFKLGKD